ncbi:alanine racemase [Nocardia jiangxiensis]|uniref:Alanine racemase n=1 Tax=Nocardia jiangxiensis TaxID=282685 RepID=A0ABW6S213_9NOCA|nr:alanine racemase [Nocardia jiangxiensis]
MTASNQITAPNIGPALAARQSEWASAVQADPTLLGDIAHAVGGPFHVIDPGRFAANLDAFRAALRAAGVQGRIYFGKKANKAGAWLDECARHDGGVDVASAPELVHALGHGVRGREIVVTGPAKSTELLWLAARHECLIAIDDLDELERLVDVGVAARILLRVLPPTGPNSRFGLDPEQLDRALERCVQVREHITMDGFSFHLDGYLPQPRADLANELIDRCLDARARGLAATAIDIGGGFACEYVDPEDWRRFQHDYSDEWFHAAKQFNRFYPYHQAPVGADMLTAVLERVGSRFVETGTRLLCEPGRALLDQAGFTVFPVQGCKARGEHFAVTVGGLSMSISEQWKGSEFLPDPLLWPAGDSAADDGPIAAFIGGSSCLEYDVLTWRKIAFERAPRYGDLIVYPNTAGYQMDKNESGFHQLPLPPKVRIHTRDGRYTWSIDSH